MTHNKSFLFTRIAPSEALRSVRDKDLERMQIVKQTREFIARGGAVWVAPPFEVCPKRAPKLARIKVDLPPKKYMRTAGGVPIPDGAITLAQAMRLFCIDDANMEYREAFVSAHEKYIVLATKTKAGCWLRYFDGAAMERLARGDE